MSTEGEDGRRGGGEGEPAADGWADVPPAEDALSRRNFLRRAVASAVGGAALAAGGAALLGGWPGPSPLPLGKRARRSRHAPEGDAIPGEILGASAKTGHLLREGRFPAPERVERAGIAIVGGGIAGLTAAWTLDRAGFADYRLYELEDSAGGNARAGANAISAYPWGAHYLPIPGPEATEVRELLQDLGAITGYDARGLPVYDELMLCADPHERLLMHGIWQDGLVPQVGITARDRAQYREFFGEMERLKAVRGRDGRPAFAIPLELSSRDPELLALDRETLAAYVARKGWDSPYLRWYLDYSCRDDFGTGIDQVSAWAGIQYFAARTGRAANAEPGAVLTWPEGNAWLANRLRERAGERVRCGSLVWRIEEQGAEVAVDRFEPATGRSVRTLARAVVLAAPRFVAERLLSSAAREPSAYLRQLSYAPWMVANVSLREAPEGRGAPLSWDNVSYHSRSLGYINATHQSLVMVPRETVLTFYQPLDEGDPAQARKAALAREHGEWASQVASELERMHPGIRSDISRIDVWLWGHAMARPLPGLIWGEARQEALRPRGRVFFAHSDLSGMSIFEEAHHWGARAARGALRAIGLARAGRA